MVAHECWGGGRGGGREGRGEEGEGGGRGCSKLYIMYKLWKLLTEGHDSH